MLPRCTLGLQGVVRTHLSWIVLSLAPSLTAWAEEKPLERIVEGKPMPLSAAAKETIKKLQDEKIDEIHFDPNDVGDVFAQIKDRIDKLGITVRLKSSGSGRRIPSRPLALRDIPLSECMKSFHDWALWGWIVYEDGSITYFDTVCGCGHPRKGLEYHAAQYEAGKSENVAKLKSQPGYVDIEAGFVPDEATAVAITVAVRTAHLGKEQVEKEGPHSAFLEEGIWVVYGKDSPKNSLTSVSLARIRKSNGAILEIRRGE
jgi:hypothetical protein